MCKEGIGLSDEEKYFVNEMEIAGVERAESEEEHETEELVQVRVDYEVVLGDAEEETIQEGSQCHVFGEETEMGEERFGVGWGFVVNADLAVVVE